MLSQVLVAALLIAAALACESGGNAFGEVPLKYSREVQDARLQGRAVVALESTIISHGMPYPENVRTALEVEAEVRAEGAVPATIAIMNGVVCVGLSPSEIEELGKLGTGAQKTSRRDVAAVVASGRTGATTVSATMLIAHRAGIRVFVTGGIGGVHRGAETTMDVSADLTELGRTPVTVVCAGAKSILDIPLTLEVLETNGVTVIAYQSDNVPAFYLRDSGYKAHMRLDTERDVAAVVHANYALQLNSGVLVTCPIPEEHAPPSELINRAISEALVDADARGIAGKEVTPFLLQRISEITGGQSLASNIELVKNNARIGSRIAVAEMEMRGVESLSLGSTIE